MKDYVVNANYIKSITSIALKIIKDLVFQKRYIAILFIILFSVSLAYSQNYRISHYAVNQGLSQSVIHTIFQDSRGFIWAGTQDGLNRFDGYTFVKYLHNPNDSNSLSDSWIYAITEDIEGNLWIGTRRGLNKFNFKSNKFTSYLKGSDERFEPLKNNVYGCVTNSKGEIFTNTPPLINLINPKTGVYKHYVNNVGQNPNVQDKALPIIIDKDGEVWAATTFGLARLNPITGDFTNYQNNPADINSINHNSILSIYEDNKGLIWVGTPLGFNIFNKQTNEFKHFTLVVYNNPLWIRSIVQDKKGYFWVGTEENGIFKLSIKESDIFIETQISASDEQTTSHLNHSNVIALLIDRTNNLWIGTLNGLNKTDLKDPRFTLYRKSNESCSVDLLDNVIASIYKHKNGDIWVGNWGKGLNIYNRATNKVTHYSSNLIGKYYIPNNYVHVIFEYNQNEIWIGTRNGIFVFNNNRFVPLGEFYNSNKLPKFIDKRVFCIVKDKKNNVWVATQGGLFYVDMQNKSYKRYSAENEPNTKLSDNLVYSLTFDCDSNLWIATKNGLDKFSNSTKQISHLVKIEGDKNTLSDNYTVSLCYTSDSSLWIGTKSGINKLNLKNNSFTYYTEADGLVSNTVYEIIEDDAGNLWFGTGKGLSHMQKGENRIITYSEEDGLQGPEFNHRASHKSYDGEIFFGGMNGFNSFYPKKITNNQYVPSIAFTSFQKQNKVGTQNVHIINSSKVVLNYGDYAFNVEFSALEYTSPAKNNYAYKLVGTSNDWINIGSRRFLTFSNMAPGLYELWIKGSNNDLTWNESGSFIQIRVKPPWWRSTVAYFTYVILIFTAIILFIKFRERALKEQKRYLEHKVKERTEEVECQKNEIMEKNYELEEQNYEILSQRDLLTNQNEKISKQNKQIKDSIQYASRIQSAILPSTSIFSELNIEHFLIFQPKDIVSGDFYWVKTIQNHLLLAIADCTGHGVPGAFMSMLGNSFLNEIVTHNDTTKASHVLDKLRDLIITSLKQSGEDGLTRDGMDIAFCELDTTSFVMQYAGAHISLVIIRNNQIIELLGDRRPVGLHSKEAFVFTNHMVQLEKGDQVYLFTDGIFDQFGGEEGKKYMYKRLKQLLLEINEQPMETQKQLITQSIYNWMGNEYEQIDDITLLGLRF